MRGVFVAVAFCCIAGCSAFTPASYSVQETRRMLQVYYGTVESVRAVRIEGNTSSIGALAGAVLGGIAANAIGEGRGKAAATTLGAVAGALAGESLEAAAGARPGVEITVRLDSGSVVAIVQEDDGELWRVGERVRVLRDAAGRARVAPISEELPSKTRARGSML